MLSALRLTYLTCSAMSYWMHRDGEPWRCKKATLSSTKFFTRVTVADKLVLVNSFWWTNYFFHCLMRCLFAVSSWFVQRASLTVNIDLSDVTNRYNTVAYGTVAFRIGIWEKRIDHWCSVALEKSQPSASLVSHWNGGPSGWGFLSTLDTNDEFYLSHIPRTSPWER